MAVLQFGLTGSAERGYLSVTRTVSLGTTWTSFEIRDPAFSGEADVSAQLSAMGLTAADLQDRGVLRSISVLNVGADGEVVYLTEFGTAGGTTVNPTNAYASVPLGAAVERLYPFRRGLTSAQVKGSGSGVLASVELTFDLPPEE